nr:MAG TPA: hypothetical protein [Bacteriophage sp.]
MPRCCINFSLKATHIFHCDYMSRFLFSLSEVWFERL